MKIDPDGKKQPVPSKWEEWVELVAFAFFVSVIYILTVLEAAMESPKKSSFMKAFVVTAMVGLTVYGVWWTQCAKRETPVVRTVK